MAAGQLWAGVDVGKEHHWVCVVDDTGAVVLSRKLVNDVYSVDLPKGTITTVPTTLKTAGSFLVRVESDLDYKPVITWAAADKKTLGLT